MDLASFLKFSSSEDCRITIFEVLYDGHDFAKLGISSSGKSRSGLGSDTLNDTPLLPGLPSARIKSFLSGESKHRTGSNWGGPRREAL